MANTAASVLSVARGEIGYCRWDDPAAGTKYGRWYAQGHGSYYAQSGVPFCAMFVSWVFAQSGATCAGLPAAYCPYVLNDARGAGKVLADKTRARPGDVVLFDWDGGVVDHVGVVETNAGSYVQTIEGNTTIGGRSGSVGRRTRAWSQVAAVVRPSYSSDTEAKVREVERGVYRLYNPNSGDHMLTASLNEANSLASAGWTYEGAPIRSAASGGRTVYRLYSPSGGTHMWTVSSLEAVELACSGWAVEGRAWTAPSEGTEVHRLYNKNNGQHMWTTDTNERDTLARAGWTYEGVAFMSA